MKITKTITPLFSHTAYELYVNIQLVLKHALRTTLHQVLKRPKKI